MYAILTAVLTIMIDQGSKYLLGLQDQVLIPGILEISYTRNQGISMGLFSSGSIPVTILSAAVCIGLTIFVIRRKDICRLKSVFAGMIVGGGIGNLIDRIRLGYVTDFLNLLFIRFYVFNLADVFIVSGAILLAVSLIREKKDA